MNHSHSFISNKVYIICSNPTAAIEQYDIRFVLRDYSFTHACVPPQPTIMLSLRANPALNMPLKGRLPLRAVSRAKPRAYFRSLHAGFSSSAPSFRTYCAPPGGHKDGNETTIDSDGEKVSKQRHLDELAWNITCCHCRCRSCGVLSCFLLILILQDLGSSSSSYDEEEVENNPELHPLKEALLRAQRRREEATGIREALEAEAQEVAQLAVEAETAYKKAQKQLEDSLAELKAAEAVVENIQRAISSVQAELSAEGAAYSGDMLEATVDFVAVPDADDADADAGEESDEGADDGELQMARSQKLEDDLWEKTRLLEKAKASVKDINDKVGLLQQKLAALDEGYRRADAIAAAAMEAAEEAVRNEMDCITVSNETESALVKAIEDLKFLDDSSERREEEFDKIAKAAVSVVHAVEQGQSPVLELAAVSATSNAVTLTPAQKTQKTAPTTSPEKRVEEKLEKIAGPAVSDEGLLPPLPRQRGLQWHLSKYMALFYRYRYALIGGLAIVFLGGAALHAVGAHVVVMSKMQEAAALVNQCWTVLAELISRLPLPHVHKSEEGILETIWLLLASVITVPLVCKIPGGSPVLGFLAGGALIGPYALGIIQDVESIRHLAELGVVFLLFNIGLELSFDRLRSMQKYVFGMGTAQVVTTLAAVAYIALAVLGNSLGGPGAVILGGGLALSTTAVGMQVLQDRGETGSRHGRAAFSVLLLQDLAVVVLLMLIPLLAPSPDNVAGAAGLVKIAKAIGFASIKAVICMASIIIAGRTLLQPLYRRVADTGNAEIFAALTLLVVLGTSLLTQVAGLSLALGAFLAGLLLAETEFHIQVESDIAPYKGLLMGLFFMTVGMEISAGLLLAKWKTVLAAITLLIGGKVAIMMAVGQTFGLSLVQSLRSGLLLSPGGEFAFVLFGEAVSRGILGAALAKELYLVVALSMALTPFLAEFGGKVGRLLERNDMKALAPKEGEMSGMSGHVIIAGFGRVGQLIAQMLSEELIPFVALDVSSTRVQDGKANDLPVYFGDAGSPAVLHSIGAERAACAVITLDTPGANYRSVWALHKHFPHIKTFVRAHDISAGIMLEKAGATAVVPEVLEPSLQLAAAVLSELNVPEDEVAETIRSFRKNHLSELQMLAQLSGSSLGYGASPDGKGREEVDQSFAMDAMPAAT